MRNTTIRIILIIALSASGFEHLAAQIRVGFTTDKTEKSIFQNDDFIRVQQAVDARSSAALKPYLKDKDQEIRLAAVKGCSSFTDTTLITSLLPLLNDRGETIREYCAYAIGQFGKSSGIQPLLNRLKKEKNIRVQETILEALGKSANSKDDVVSIEKFYSIKKGKALPVSGIAKTILRLHLKKLESPVLLDAVIKHVDTNSEGISLNTAMALARYKGKYTEEQKAILAKKITATNDPEILCFAITILPAIDSEDAVKLLSEYALKKQNDIIVRVAALQTLRKNTSIAASELIPLLSDTSDIIVKETLETIDKLTAITDDDFRSILLLTDKRSAPVRARALKISLKKSNNLVSKIFRGYFSSTDPYDQVAYAGSMAAIPQMSDSIYSLMLLNNNYAVRTALCESWLATINADELNEDFTEKIENAVALNDVSVTALCAIYLSGHLDQIQNPDRIKDCFNSSLDKLGLPRDIETYNEVVALLEQLGETIPAIPAAGITHPVDIKKLAGLTTNLIAEVVTNKGKFIIALNAENAPASVINFMDQTEVGLFNNKSFHRVIPNFVAQGGCPRGDGMGGMNYTIRSEFASHNYISGAVGLASAGRDTESCQWFVSLIPTPHLEGRYTIIGYVTSGLEVVRNLGIGDRIISVSIREYQ